MTGQPRWLIDDRVLIEHLLVGVDGLGSGPQLDAPFATTSLWYYRATRAAVLGAGGQLSGPFRRLDDGRQAAAIRRLLELPDDIALPDPRRTVPRMAELAERYPRLNVLTLEAAAAALVLDCPVALSARASQGRLASVLDDHGVAWIAIPTS